MGTRSRKAAEGSPRRSREGKDVALSSTAPCGRLEEIFNTFFPLSRAYSPATFGKVRLVCGRRVSDPDVGRTGAHDESRIISPGILMRPRAAGRRFNNRSLRATR